MEGEPPTNIRLPVLLFTANYYLTDVTDVAHGPTQVIPGSHLFGAPPPAIYGGHKVGREDRVLSGMCWQCRYVQQSGVASWCT
jgi:hypothetical protein